jgi:glutaminase
MYDYAGRWAVDVGIPAKSGVSGGVMAVVNRQIGIGLYSPRLDEHGNSVRGIKACVQLAEEFGLHAFEFSNTGSSLLSVYL